MVKDTSKDFEHMLGVVNTQDKPATLSEFLGLSDIPQTVEEAEQQKKHDHMGWRKHWVGMPEFESENKEPAKQLIISFKTEEDYQKFGEFIGQKLTKKTKSIFWPYKPKAEMTVLRWVDEDTDWNTSADSSEDKQGDEDAN